MGGKIRRESTNPIRICSRNQDRQHPPADVAVNPSEPATGKQFRWENFPDPFRKDADLVTPIADQPDPNAAIRIVHDFRHERQARHSVLAKLTQINGMAAFDLQRIERDLDQGAVVAAPDSTFVFEKCYSFQGGRSLKTIATQHPGSLVSGKADLIARVDTHQRWQVGKLGPFVIIGFPPEKIPLPTPQMAPSGASTRFDTKA